MKIRIGCCPVLNVSVCSWCGQMFERSRCRGLRVLLLSGKLDLRHRRDAWNLWTLPPHCCDLQHRGGINSLSVHHTIHLSTCLSVCLTCVCVFLSRVKPLWRKVCTASLRESHPRFSRLSAAATSSRGWSLRFVNSRLSITPRAPLWSPLTKFVFFVLLKVQEECYTSLDICTVARTNPDAIGEVVQVPTHFPNRSGHTHLSHTPQS